MSAAGIKPDVAGSRGLDSRSAKVSAYNTFIAVCMRAKERRFQLAICVFRTPRRRRLGCAAWPKLASRRRFRLEIGMNLDQADAMSYCTMIDAFAQSGELPKPEPSEELSASKPLFQGL